MLRSIFVVLVMTSGLARAAVPELGDPGGDPRRESGRKALRLALGSVLERAGLKQARVSAQVRSLDDGSVVFAHDADELLNPASNVKLVTAAAALARLGPDYRYDTEFLTDAEVKEGKAKVLYVRGKGDPTLTTERLYGIVSELAHTGLKEIATDLVLDDTFFDADRMAPGFDQETGDKAYLAPTGALSLNWNTVCVYLRPGESLGAAGTVEVEPPSDYFVLDATLATGSKTHRRYSVSSAVDVDRVRQKLEVRGVVPLEKGSWQVWKKIDQPTLYFGFTLKAMLQQRGLKVKGRIKTGPVPASAKVLYLAQSDTLDVVLKKLNKHSSNFVAEQLVKTLGAEGRGVPGSIAKGIDVVEAFLEDEVGLPRGTYVMKNGSGLNDTNRFSAAQLNRLLQVMWQRSPLAPEYLSSLGIAGKDGTLKYRFEGSDAVGRLRAKTGTLENVSALSGYVQSVGGERFIFSALVNDFSGRASSVVPHLDALGAAVASAGSSGGPGAAVASLVTKPQVVGSEEELVARLSTYTVLAQKADRRNAPFLRTAWRSERDPAVRAIIADALYQSDPREPTAVKILLDSALASSEVFGRLRSAARVAKLDPPLMGSLLELASSGNGDAIGRLLEFVRVGSDDVASSEQLAEQLAVVAHDAPLELLVALEGLSEASREPAIAALVRGLVRAAQPELPLWTTLRDAQGAADPKLVRFAKALELVLSQRIAVARAPAPAGGQDLAKAPPRAAQPSGPGAAVPGG